MEFIEISAKNVDDAITQATVQLGITSDQLEYEVLDKGSTGFLGIGSKNAVIKARKKFSIDENVVEFLSSIFDAMKMEVEILVAVNEEEHIIEVELKGDDMGILIGNIIRKCSAGSSI
jgi:spoIIIJ-associated protein